MSTWQIALAIGGLGILIYQLSQIVDHLKAIRSMVEWRNWMLRKDRGLED